MTTRVKTCFKCGAMKPLTSYYKHPMMADGHLGKCIPCTRDDVNKNRQEKAEYYKAYDRKRGFRVYDELKVKVRAATKKLDRKPCEFCGNPKSDGHHDDYTKPTEIRWLCRKHHMEHHRKYA
jgi:hypothetical protein